MLLIAIDISKNHRGCNFHGVKQNYKALLAVLILPHDDANQWIYPMMMGTAGQASDYRVKVHGFREIFSKPIGCLFRLMLTSLVPGEYSLRQSQSTSYRQSQASSYHRQSQASSYRQSHVSSRGSRRRGRTGAGD